jgi:hypothetical protein
MITKNEIDTMLALLPESTEKMKQILNWASAYVEMLGGKFVSLAYHDEIVMSARKEIVKLERSRDDWMDLHRQAHLRISELEDKLNAIREFLTPASKTA